MDDKLDDIIRQYDFTVKARYRARGGTLLDTTDGLVLLKSLEGSKKHLQVEQAVTTHLFLQGYEYTDRILTNKEGELCSRDSYGNDYVLRRGFRGEECSLRDLASVKAAAENLAHLHEKLKDIQVEPSFTEPEPGEEASMEQEAEEQNSKAALSSQKDSCSLKDIYVRHNREMKRVRAYIKGKNHKNEFEVCVLKNFESFYSQADESMGLLEASGYGQLIQQAVNRGIYVHGNYNYHNILFLDKGIATTHFDQAGIGMQVRDLYDLMRKTMEKNHWNPSFGMELLESYRRVKDLSKEENTLLYIQLLYPEKYWKILNYYYNSKKSWMSSKNMQKLLDIQAQAEEKKQFLARFKARVL